MKLKEVNFGDVAKQIKYGKLPEQEESNDICIEDLKKKLPFTWGVSILNEHIGLINYNRFIVIAGEGASGKTTYSIQQALDNANNGHKVAYMSLEMGRRSLITNIARNSAGIEKQKEYGKEVVITQIQKNIFEREKEKLQKNEYLEIIGYKESLKIDTFGNELTRLAEQHDMIFIDNLGMIDRGKKESELLPLLTEIILKIRQKHKVTIVALHHMSKGNENQKGPRGKNAIRGSGKILDDADIILTISRDETCNLFSVVKDRDYGLIKDFRMIFDRGKFISDLN